ncbi:MAG TPA: murein L,D-transpeptidase family protein [Roseiarcus sp.]|nr:murein L,D-transpeptidase family protein [Roseiarcus sp.]
MGFNHWRLAGFGLAGAAAALLAGCEESYLDNGPGRSEHPISSATLAEMNKIDTTPSSPTLIRTYKKEAELEIWKMKSDGHYALLKTYPMCRWSGQLGPKKREGDMQVPEGFYAIAPGQMNPNSHYYLSFNVGYPNAYDRAYGRSGGNVMVHGVCSSAGCFSMTDEQIDDIYAIARDSFRGGQREIQLQSFPFRMTAENMAKYRLDPNIDFWKELKSGSDHFEVTKTEPPVVVCGKHYEFGATANGPVSATSPCPALKRDDDVETAVAEKASNDTAKVAELVASGVKAIRTVYADGGQHPVFAGWTKDEVSDPEALANPPQEIVLEDRAKPVPASVKVAGADPAKRAAAPEAKAIAAAPEPAPQTATLASAAADKVGGIWGASTSNVKKWLRLGGDQPVEPAATAYVPQPAPPADVPLPPRRETFLGQGEKPQHMALHVAPTPPAKPAAAATTEKKPAKADGLADAPAEPSSAPAQPQ